jgi:putative ABC transport system permease protein
MLVESVLLFLVGGALGLVLARWTLDALLAFSVGAGYVPQRMSVAVDVRVLVFGLVLSLVSGVLSGLVPALQASRVDLNATLKGSSQTTSGGPRRVRASRVLIVSEIAVSLVLLVGAGLVIRSFLQLEAIGGGIDAENLVLAQSDGGRDFSAAVTYWHGVLERVRQFPGVQFAAVTSRPPVHGARGQAFVVDTPSNVSGDGDARAGDILISPDYFPTMGIPVLKGRVFTDRDGGSAPAVAIISQSLARRYFPDGDALGRRVSFRERSPMTCCSAAGPVEGVWREIVGVVADVRQANLDEQPAMTIYRPYSQIVEHDMYLMVRARSHTDETRIISQLRKNLLAMDPSREWSDVRAMQDVIDGSESIRIRRFVFTLLGSFAALALLLAAVGTYGVMAYAVAERTREIAIRVAFGATRSVVLEAVLGEAARLTAAGLVLGAVAAQFSTRAISTFLFGVSSTDAVTYVGASLVLGGLALLASYVPARRAMQVDPLVALRQE